MADIIDLRSTDFAASDTPFAYFSEAGKKLLVVEFGGQFDADLPLNLNGNPFHMTMLLSYDSREAAGAPETAVPFADWIGTPEAVDIDHGWLKVSDNPIENAQEYSRWIKLGETGWNGQVAVCFAFNAVFDLTSKSQPRGFSVAGGKTVNWFRTPYADRNATLFLRSSRNERIEVWKEGTGPYLDGSGNPLVVAEMVAKFNRFAE